MRRSGIVSGPGAFKVEPDSLLRPRPHATVSIRIAPDANKLTLDSPERSPRGNGRLGVVICGPQLCVLLLPAIEHLPGDPSSVCFNTATICSMEKRLVFTAHPLVRRW